jgi:hypothetical protein
MNDVFKLGVEMDSPSGAAEVGKWFSNEITIAQAIQNLQPKFAEVEVEVKYPSPKNPSELWSFYVSGSFKRDPKTKAAIGHGSMFRVNALFVAAGVEAEMINTRISPSALAALTGKKVISVRYYNGEKWKNLAFPFKVGTPDEEIARAVDSELNYSLKRGQSTPQAAPPATQGYISPATSTDDDLPF